MLLDFLERLERRIAHITFPTKTKPAFSLKYGAINDTFDFFLQLGTLHIHDSNIFRK